MWYRSFRGRRLDMGEVPLSLKVETKQMLDDAAHRQQISADGLVERAIRYYLEVQEYERNILQERIEEAEKGIFISGEAMTRWVNSWGTENELPPSEPDIFPETPR
jgi:predicted transcriptional regulator